jgi:hypothetical protein
MLNFWDDSGLPWSFLDGATDPALICEGAWPVVGEGTVRAVAQVTEVEGDVVRVRPLPGTVDEHRGATYCLTGLPEAIPRQLARRMRFAHVPIDGVNVHVSDPGRPLALVFELRRRATSDRPVALCLMDPGWLQARLRIEDAPPPGKSTSG